MKKWYTLTAAVAIFAVAAMVWAEPGRDGNRGSERGQHGRPSIANMLDNPQLVEKLGLTDEQLTALKDGAYQKEKECIPLQAEQRTVRLEMRKLMDQDSPSEEAVLALVEKEGSINTELKKLETKYRLQVRAIVGPEKVQQLHKQFRKAMKQRQGEGKGEGKGDGDKRHGEWKKQKDRGERGPEGKQPPWMDDDGPEDEPEVENEM
ncbi:MAG: periplasmic heavy metal sensor [Verrucomicrobia bacterium]|nr:periplasmic heavy metal sensor [Verrucomicrobiota bacterium]